MMEVKVEVTLDFLSHHPMTVCVKCKVEQLCSSVELRLSESLEEDEISQKVISQ